MADWSLPVLGTEYTQWKQALNGRLVDAALMFDSGSTAAINIPTGAKRWNSSASKFEKFDGSAWSDLSSLYAINISGNATTATTAATANGLASGVALANLGDKSITHAKIQDVSAQYRLLGRRSVGAGTIEEVTATQLFDWYGTTRGSLICRGSSSWAMLPPGTSGQVLMSGGAGADLRWETISLSGYAPLANPDFTGTPLAPTASTETNTRQIATTAFVSSKVASVVASKVGVDNGYNAVGSIMLVYMGGSMTITAGSTLSGAGLYAVSLNGVNMQVGSINLGQLLSGTHRVLTRIGDNGQDFIIFLAQRIA